MDDDLMTVEEVAKTLRVGRPTVLLLIRSGEFAGALRATERGSWRIPRAALDAYIARQQEAAQRRAAS